MVRLLGVTLFLATMIVASDCQCQLIGNGWVRNRPMRTATPLGNSLTPTRAEYTFEGSTNSIDQASEYSDSEPTIFTHSTSAAEVNSSQFFRYPAQAYYSSGQSRFSRLIDGPMTHKYRNPAEVDARYTGGFHQSHFENIGLPSGDIGLRGNALNWRTW